MTTQQVADRYMELEKEGKWNEIQAELYSNDIISLEPAHAASMGMEPEVRGLDAVKEKGVKFNENIAEMHGGFCSEPVVGGDYFSVAMGMDVTMKVGGRMKMDEIAVFHVKDGKIISEQFFY
jgi:hypothetical protein